jgi:hypothetical protein
MYRQVALNVRHIYYISIHTYPLRFENTSRSNASDVGATWAAPCALITRVHCDERESQRGRDLIWASCLKRWLSIGLAARILGRFQRSRSTAACDFQPSTQAALRTATVYPSSVKLTVKRTRSQRQRVRSYRNISGTRTRYIRNTTTCPSCPSSILDSPSIGIYPMSRSLLHDGDN